MQQIENYIFQILQKSQECSNLVSVVILSKDNGGTECVQLAERLRKWSCISKVYNVNDAPDDIDVLIFDRDCQKLVKDFRGRKPSYIAGRMTEREDYFGIWEHYRDISEGIFIECGSMGKTEILEWQRGDTDIELSIVVPVYNISKYICKCIDSLTQWKAPYVEYIFVDDGSADDSVQLIREKMQYDTRIQLIQKVNGGCASARNMGIQLAKGRYIGFVDGDDFIDRDMYYELLKRAMLGSYDFTYCGYKEYYEDSGDTKAADNDYMGEPYQTGTYRQDKVQLLAINTRVAIWRCLYKRSIMQREGICFHEDLTRFDDLPFKVEYIFAAKSAVCISRNLYYYRIGRQGQDTSCQDERLYVHFDIFKHLDKYVRDKNDQRMWDLLQIVKLNTHRYAISVIRPDLRKGYIQNVRKELTDGIGYWRCVCLVYLYMGGRNIGWVTKLWICKR